MGRLDVPHIKTEVVKLLAEGESKTNIAKQFGSWSASSRFVSEDEIRKLIKEEQTRLGDIYLVQSIIWKAFLKRCQVSPKMAPKEKHFLTQQAKIY